MKRSQINAVMRETAEFLNRMNFKLPPFAWWTYEEWKTKGHEYDEIRDNMLGWDVTDFGSGDYDKIGLLSFMIRNGNEKMSKYFKPYCEKILMQREEQFTPYHFHWNKIEDIINRGGGNLLVQLYNSTEDGEKADTPVQVYTDGRTYTAPAGTIVRLTPGESITLLNRTYHQFWGEKGTGPVLIGEVSKICEDKTDCRFYDAGDRFPTVENDEEILYPLCFEYPPAP